MIFPGVAVAVLFLLVLLLFLLKMVRRSPMRNVLSGLEAIVC